MKHPRENIPNKHIEKLKKVVLAEMANQAVTIVLFGSRAKGKNHPSSDVDIGFLPKNGKQFSLGMLEEKIESANIPYKVDLVNLKESDRVFVEKVLKEAVVWKH